jgi:hypothetical protein
MPSTAEVSTMGTSQLGEAIGPSADDLVRDYQLGHRSKAEAVEQILDSLRNCPIVASDEQRRTAFASYLQSLDNHGEQLASARTRGQVISPVMGPAAEEPDEVNRPGGEEAEPLSSDSRKRTRSCSPEPRASTGAEGVFMQYIR